MGNAEALEVRRPDSPDKETNNVKSLGRRDGSSEPRGDTTDDEESSHSLTRSITIDEGPDGETDDEG